ncbi:hypothetical protein NE237_004298 [Protea cynaroides]|uniref:Uncharacterized protein n=1 Tax=Protea cynaroides TaxID=273540 RepID=A0A9Q0KJ66_9MAGN|nr:hypothetical protein NE237_004298 [Protea cynaroides]
MVGKEMVGKEICMWVTEGRFYDGGKGKPGVEVDRAVAAREIDGIAGLGFGWFTMISGIGVVTSVMVDMRGSDGEWRYLELQGDYSPSRTNGDDVNRSLRLKSWNFLVGFAYSGVFLVGVGDYHLFLFSDYGCSGGSITRCFSVVGFYGACSF